MKTIFSVTLDEEVGDVHFEATPVPESANRFMLNALVSIMLCEDKTARERIAKATMLLQMADICSCRKGDELMQKLNDKATSMAPSARKIAGKISGFIDEYHRFFSEGHGNEDNP